MLPTSSTMGRPEPARLICIISPAGRDGVALEVGQLNSHRTTVPPPLTEQQFAAFLEKAKSLAPKYRTELLETP